MKILFFFLLFFIPFLNQAQTLEKGQKYMLENPLGLDLVRDTFYIRNYDEKDYRGGYLLDLNEDGTFSSTGQFFCGVGEKAYVYGKYRILKNNQIELDFDNIIYKEMGKETRRKTLNINNVFQYNGEKGTLVKLK